jgi:hypothetical protein
MLRDSDQVVHHAVIENNHEELKKLLEAFDEPLKRINDDIKNIKEVLKGKNLIRKKKTN